MTEPKTEAQNIEAVKKAFDAKYGQGAADKFFKAGEDWAALQLEMSKPKPVAPSLEDGPVYAFWQYDQYPYMLSGQITSYDDRYDNVWVKVRGYGNSRFTPLKLIAGDRGEAFHNLREKLCADYRQAQTDVRNDFDIRLLGLCTEFEFTEDELPHGLKGFQEGGCPVTTHDDAGTPPNDVHPLVWKLDVLILHPRAARVVARRGLVGFEIVEPQQREVGGKPRWVSHPIGYGKTPELAWRNALEYAVRAVANGKDSRGETQWCAVRGWGEAELVLAADDWHPSEGDMADGFPSPEAAIAAGRLVPFHVSQLEAFAENQKKAATP